MGEDEEGTLRRLKALRAELVDPAIARHHGRIVKTTGDGMLVEFTSVVDAVRCGVDVQEAVARQNVGVAIQRRLQFRLGINLGDVIAEDGDLFGDGVNVAARLEGLAEPGGICLSQGARDLVQDKCTVEFQDLGEIDVKNIARPIRAYRVVLGPAPAFEDSSTAVGAPLAEPRKSIAVLPFVNMSSDPENEFFSDGVSEELINLLTKLPQLRVASRTSSFSFKGKSVNVRTAARELGVKTILEGSVRRAGNRIRLTAQLIDAESDSHLWSETYGRQLEDIFAVQDEIAHRIVAALEITLSPKQERMIQKAPTTDVHAYDYYLQGRKFFYQERGGVELARRMFARAIETDPGYALAHAGVADAAAFLYMWYDKDEAHLEQAEAASRRALELDPELAEAHAARGHVLSLKRQHDEAERRVRDGDPPRSAALRGLLLLRPRCPEPGQAGEGGAALRAGERGAGGGLPGSGTRGPGLPLVGEGRGGAGRRPALRANRREARRAEPGRPPGAHSGCRDVPEARRRRARPGLGGPGLRHQPGEPGPALQPRVFPLPSGQRRARAGVPGEVRERGNCLANDSDLDAIRTQPRFQALLERITREA